MVKVLSRLIRRSTSSGSAAVDSSAHGPNAQAQEQNRDRRSSTTSSKRFLRDTPDGTSPRHLLVISDTADFDLNITHRFKAEGFDVDFIGFVSSGDSERDRKSLENAVHAKEDELEAGERYAIVAYSRPAYYLLGSHHLASSNTNPFPRLCALIAYYPLTSTDQWTRDSHADEFQLADGPACTSTSSIFDPGSKETFLPIQIHLPGHEAKSTTLWPWIGLNPAVGDTTYKKRHRCHVYTYPDAMAGFAERNIDPTRNKALHDRDQVSSLLAWSRAVGLLRRAFEVGEYWPVVDIETVWEAYWRRILGDLEGRRGGDASEMGGRAAEEKDEDRSAAILDMMVSPGRTHGGSFLEGIDLHENEGPSVECVPTKAGGSNTHTLRSFFADTFIPNGPPSQHIRLLSRTVGADQIVDEISFSFRHTAEVPWLLPGVMPTDREIQVVIVVVASFCASKIVCQNLYWDQASVLVQAGLLDERLVPRAGFSGKE